MKPCPVTSILLGNNGKVPVEEMTGIKIRIGNQWHPIDCLVVKNWRYDIIIGLDFMTTIDACIKITTKELIVGTTHKEVCNLITTALQPRSVRPIYALDETIIKTGNEARIRAKVTVNAPTAGYYTLSGRNMGTGVWHDTPDGEVTVFIYAPTVERRIRSGGCLYMHPL